MNVSFYVWCRQEHVSKKVRMPLVELVEKSATYEDVTRQPDTAAAVWLTRLLEEDRNTNTLRILARLIDKLAETGALGQQALGEILSTTLDEVYRTEIPTQPISSELAQG